MESQILTTLSIQDLQGIVFDALSNALRENTRMRDVAYKKETFIKDKDKFINVVEVSHLLGLKPATIYKKCRLGLIPYIKKGGNLRFSKAELIDYLYSGRNLTKNENIQQAKKYIQCFNDINI